MTQCKWPIGDPRHPDFSFCSARARHDGPYCQEHRDIAYDVAPAPKAVAIWVDNNVKVADGRRR